MFCDKTLEDRKTKYGEFGTHAGIAQKLKFIIRASDGWNHLTNVQKEALEMILHKIARIMNGDPNYIDSWHDICGYARLVELELEAAKPQREVNTRLEQYLYTQEPKS